MAQKEPPLDEQVWFADHLVSFYQGIHTNSVHLYFYASSFFDPASNNNQLYVQANRFPEQRYLLETRQKFEDAVKAVTSGGIQFLVVGEPETEEGAWVIQKQQRTVQQGLPDEIEVLGTYYVIDRYVFMAPSVGNVLAAKTLNITTSLTNFFTLASSLALYTPATGHTYFHPSLKFSASKLPLGATSRATSVIPADGNDTSSIALTTDTAPTSSTIGGTFSEGLFFNSLRLANNYASEFADENPLQGEPGNFRFSSTNERVAALNEATAQAALKAQTSGLVAPERMSVSQERERESAVSTAAPTPKPAGGAPGEGETRRKGSKGGMDLTKLKRRKSKGLASPVTPKEGSLMGGK